MKKIYCNLDTCLACKTCELACALAHSESKDLESAIKESPKPKQRIRLQKTAKGPVYLLQCRHCEEPACILACMSAAMSKDPKTGLVRVDEKKCVGCGMCVMACPYGALIIDDEKKISLKCDHCIMLLEKIGKKEAACVAACPTKTLVFCEFDDLKNQFAPKKLTGY